MLLTWPPIVHACFLASLSPALPPAFYCRWESYLKFEVSQSVKPPEHVQGILQAGNLVAGSIQYVEGQGGGEGQQAGNPVPLDVEFAELGQILHAFQGAQLQQGGNRKGHRL